LASARARDRPGVSSRDPHWSQNRAAEPATAPHARHRTGESPPVPRGRSAAQCAEQAGRELEAKIVVAAVRAPMPRIAFAASRMAVSQSISSKLPSARRLSGFVRRWRPF